VLLHSRFRCRLRHDGFGRRCRRDDRCGRSRVGLCRWLALRACSEVDDREN
jgi:hypothetical protein